MNGLFCHNSSQLVFTEVLEKTGREVTRKIWKQPRITRLRANSYGGQAADATDGITR
jgi:hypothetical protein